MSPFEATTEERETVSTVRAFLADFVDNAYLNEQEDSADGYQAARWKQLCDLGLTGVNAPARVGGADGTLTDAALVVRECGRAAYASPLLPTLRVATVLTALDIGTSFDDILTRIVEGLPAALVAPADRTVRAEPTRDGYRLSGSPCVVEWLLQSDTVVLLAPTTDSDTWVCATLGSDILADRSVAVPSTDNERSARLNLDGVVLPLQTVRARDVPGRTARWALARANLLRASGMAGGCEDVLDRTAGYMLDRHQFGKPLGGFQAVRHHLARMVIATDGARLLCDDALIRAESPDESAIAEAALFAAGRAYVEVVLTAAQLHGGVGTTVEHILHHHFRRAKAMQLRSGRQVNRLRELYEALVDRREASLW